MNAPSSKTRFLCAASLIGISAALALPASAIDLVIQEDPITAGTGNGYTARFPAVATVDGRSVDLFAEIVSQSQPGVTHTLRRAGNDFVFLLNPTSPAGMFGGGTPEVRQATVRYTFFSSGTSTPVTVPDFAITIPDFDGYDTRRDTVKTTDSVGYTLDQPTNVSVGTAGPEVTLAGTAMQFSLSPQPEAAAKLRFAGRSSFSIDYTSEDSLGVPADFSHDGNREFAFLQPQYTASPVRIYYTFSYTNNETDPVLMAFCDQLPEGLEWDKDYEPELTGTMKNLVVDYSNSNTLASIEQIVPGGTFSFKLRTMHTQKTGAITNEAIMKFAVVLDDGYENLDQGLAGARSADFQAASFAPDSDAAALQEASSLEPEELVATAVTEKQVTSTITLNPDTTNNGR